jgi:hypothetical protein
MSEPLQGWFIVELMGHRRLAGLVTEQTIAGAGFLRIDVPGKAPGEVRATQFYPPASVYALTPVTEELARRVAEGSIVAPVTEWDLPRPSLPPPGPHEEDCPDEEEPF